jgi:hypothetical protein
MRRILAAVFFLGLAALSGCLTAEDRAQWDKACSNLRGDNLKIFGDGDKNPYTGK